MTKHHSRIQCSYCEYRAWDAQDLADHLCLKHEHEVSSLDQHDVPASVIMRVANYFRARAASKYESDEWF